MRRLPFALAALLAFAPASGVPAQDSLSAVELAASAGREAVSWDPSWPAELPPDAFAAAGGPPASVELRVNEAAPSADASSASLSAGSASVGAAAARGSAESAGGDAEKSAPYLVRWDSAGLPSTFSYFLSGSRFDLSVSRDKAGRIIRVSVAEMSSAAPEGKDANAAAPKAAVDKPAAAKPAAPAGADSKKADPKAAGSPAASTIVLTYDSGGLLASAVSEAEDGVGYSSFFRSLSTVDEIRYDEAGLALSRDTFTVSSRGVVSRAAVAEDGAAALVYRRDYDAGGRTTRLETAEGPVEIVYDRSGRPVSVHGVAGDRRLQWDERGLLVREIETGADGKRIERAYSYVFNERRDWIQRSSVVYEERFGVMTGTAGPAVVRSIRYRR